MTTTKQYDFLNRLLSVSSAPSAASALSFAYDYNSPNQRTRRVEADGSYWRYGYDYLGQVKSGAKFWPDQTPVAGQQFGYTFDDIGNRVSTCAGGDQSGASLRSANYSANNLNQYTSRDVPGAVDVMGLELATNAVTVNGQVAYRKGEYFPQQLTVTNGTTALWTNITVSATNETTVSGNQFVPKNQEQFSYDPDGNVTNDGRWAYTWDAENRLTTLVPNTVVGPQISLKFEYDAKSRRIHKQVWPNTTQSGYATNDLKFLYDGWNPVAQLNASNNNAIQCYMWGLDLSGSVQGAGGVGGLLELNDSANGAHFAAFDGNGSVAALAKATDGTISARYEYGPFGEVVRATGPTARANSFRFSSKYQDDETDLLYYGYRYYNTLTAKWLSTDPLQERASANLYAFVQNAPTDEVDLLGLATSGGGCCGPDVTSTTLRTLQEIETNFRAWSYLDKLRACSALYRSIRSARGAWYIKEFHDMGYGVAPAPPALQGTWPNCQTTVVYNGRCHHAGDVNFVMWGKVNALCYQKFGITDPGGFGPYTLPTAVAAVVAWKLYWHWQTGEDLGYMFGSISFTVAGYTNPLLPTHMHEYRNCLLRPGNRCRVTYFQWHWRPVHPL